MTPTLTIAGMTAASKQLNIEPVITAKEMADPEVDHLGVMAYAAWFQHTKGNLIIRLNQLVLSGQIILKLILYSFRASTFKKL